MLIRILIFVSVSLITLPNYSLDLETVKKLNGKWKFKIGDNETWSKATFNDSDWDEIYVPGTWEENGYMGYNGYAWYRQKFSFNKNYNDSFYYLVIDNIDDADEIYINGKQIGYMGNFPPEFKTAAGYQRIYPIPSSFLKSENTIAVRIYDQLIDGGIMSDVKICYDANASYLSVDLSGNWKFKTSHNKEWRFENLDDSNWDNVQVPMTWEAQGYRQYDGYAWYRKTFTIPEKLANEDLVLVLGKIDDIDVVYFNGELVGTILTKIKSKKSHNWNVNKHNAWSVNRVYEIPGDLIKTTNTIAIAVFDQGDHGGIYQGPVGIMTKKQYAESRINSNPYDRKSNPIERALYSIFFD
jgi:hypothetical protein